MYPFDEDKEFEDSDLKELAFTVSFLSFVAIVMLVLFIISIFYFL